MQFFTILTVELPGGPRVTSKDVVTVKNGGSRHEIFDYMLNGIVKNYGDRFAQSSVLFFTAEPESIG